MLNTSKNLQNQVKLVLLKQMVTVEFEEHLPFPGVPFCFKQNVPHR